MSSSGEEASTAVGGEDVAGGEPQSEKYELPDNVDRTRVVTEPGVRVVDREDDDPDRDTAVVINAPPSTCEEWDAYYDRHEDGWVSVAEDNPDYDPDAPVVVIAFLPDLEDSNSDILPIENAVSLNSLEISYYSFPPGRLKIVDIPDHVEIGNESNGEASAADESEKEADSESDAEPAEPDGEDESEEPPEWELSEEFEALRDRLAESATVEVDHTEDGPVLAVEKLGTSYRIQEDGTITGDGALRDRLNPLVDEYL
ncbi:hypothetical protein SAMN05216388_10528 [Halorientalis persicus]|uniref:Uncharacterized protein n=1 Tax=Halorientalis persicus TaxID=1367881 RepID=A0A1H8W9V0_9EURY|nr:hypothetical protein [Halorientalis persicus]SEP24177.1 hypothetical protein SAMN05216388_10528 [Halorientalis persicus]